jgi:hypothetical protein
VAKLESVTAPLVVRFADGSEKVVAACFPHPLGALYLDLFWHQRSPAEAAHLLRGELSGDGPWRVGDARIRLLGCHNTDPHLMDQFGPWREYLEQRGDEYPPQAQILEIAARLGARVATAD